MRDLLFLCHRVPYPPNKGDKIRAWNMIVALARNWRVHLGCLVDDPADWSHLPRLREVCADVGVFRIHPRRQRIRALLTTRPGVPLTLGYFRSAGLLRWVADKLRDRDIRHAFAFSSSMAPYLMKARPLTRILDMVDVDSDKWAAYAADARGPMRAVWAREARTLLTYERLAASRFDRTLFVSAQEAARFVALAPEARDSVGVLENGVDLDYFSPDTRFQNPLPGEGPVLVFTGTMDYRPNVDAVVWFAREVLPLVRTTWPTARFAIVGANPAREVSALADLSGVIVTGRVPDTRPYLAHAALVVAPLRIARGIQNKVLEAMAAGRPVLATPDAFEGIHAMPGRDLLVAAGPTETARLAAEVLSGAHAELGASARRLVEERYDWRMTLRPLDQIAEA